MHTRGGMNYTGIVFVYISHLLAAAPAVPFFANRQA